MRHWENLSIRSLFCGATIALGLLCAPSGRAEEVAATPYRPTVSNPAQLSAPGWLEMEAGWDKAWGAQRKRMESGVYLLKYAFDAHTAVLFGQSAFLREVDADGARRSGMGDSSLLLKHQWTPPDQDVVSLGVEYGANLATAAHGLGSGEVDALGNGIASFGWDGWTLDANFGAACLGEIGSGEGRCQKVWAAALSRQVGDWTLAAELSGGFREGTATQRQFLASASYALHPRLVLDGGFAAGLNDTSKDASVFAGMVILLGRISSE